VTANREIVAAGARAAGRDPGEVAIIEYIRVCVDDDMDVARRAFVKALMGYALAWPGTNTALGYRGHFGRMGFDAALTELEDRRNHGAAEAELIDAFPVELAEQVGYFGPASGAAAAVRRLAEGLDTAIVRVVPGRPGLESINAVMDACTPSRVSSQS
jgi:alkanesulfonate monooxygenase SsuD/methylene tetrahydromethanopterin reductase-like flavin-dependent oxidoreductase (luciferase family)